MAEVLLNDFSTTLAATLAADATACTVTAGVPASAVGSSGRVRIGTEILLATFTTATGWTLTREAEDADRYPRRAWPAGTAVDAVLTAAGLAGVVAASPASVSTGHTLWVDAVNGSDATGTRGRQDKPYLTLTAAKAAALAGDTIQVRPGSYTVAVSLAGHTHWDFDAGAAVTRSDAAAGSGSGLFDDGGAAAVFDVTGGGTLDRVAAAAGTTSVIRSAHAGSDISVRCRTVTGSSADQTRTHYPVSCEAGRLYVEADYVGHEDDGVGPISCCWWRDGDLHVRAKRIACVSSGGAAYQFGIHSDCDAATPAGEMFVEADEITATTSCVHVNFLATSSVAALWVRALVIRAAAPTGAVLTVEANNRTYVEAQKFFGLVSLAQGAALVYLRAQKWAALRNGSGPDVGLLFVSDAFAGRAIIDAQDVDPAGFTGTMFAVAGGTTEIRGMRYVANAGSNGFELSGGTLKLVDCHIDTSANASTNPITVSGGTVELVNCTLIAATGRDAISAATPQTVIIAGTLTTNTAPNANVTLSGGMLVRSDTGVVTVQGTKITTPVALVIGDSSSPAPTTTQGIAVGAQNTLSGSGLNLVAYGAGNTVSSSQSHNAAIGVSNTIGGTATSSFCFGISNTITGAAQSSVVGTNHSVNGRQLVYAFGNGASFTQDFSVALGQAPASDTTGSLVFGGFLYDPVFQLQKFSSTNNSRHVGGLIGTYADSTDATRTGRVSLVAYSVTTAQEGVRVEANAAGVRLGFFGGAAVAKPAVTGSRGGNAALQSLLTQLASLGLVTDSTTA